MGVESPGDWGRGAAEEAGLTTRGVTPPSDEPEVRATAPMARISRYVVLEEIGRGGMGRVLRAYDPKLQREVALKEVRRAVLDEEMTQRLIVEARAMARLSHPNVVSVYDVEVSEAGTVVLVMELVAGVTLQRWLAERTRSWQEVVGCFIEAGRGLVAAHQAGLLHRDFKPANVLIGERGIVKVTDFGLAKGVAGSLESPVPSPIPSVVGGASGAWPSPEPSLRSFSGPTEGLTHDGVVLGTPRYMAPEQHGGAALTPAADQYAFCVALWEGLCGKPPFNVRTLVADKRAGPPAWTNPAVPRPIVEAVRRGLSPEPIERWPDVDALLQALAWDPARRRRRAMQALAGFAIVGLGVATLQAWASSRGARCSGAEARLQGAWDEAKRHAVESAIVGIGRTYAAEVWTRTRDRLDAYGSAWAAMHREACEATTVRGEQSTEVLDLRMGCLHRAKVQLEAVTDVLAQADEGVVAKAHRLVEGLTPLERCADVETLRSGVEPPREGEVAAVEQARALVAQAKAQSEAGRFAEARETIARGEAVLEGVEYLPVWIELRVQQGHVQDGLGAYADAEATLMEGLTLAVQLGDLQQMQAAATRLLYVVGYQSRRMDEALQRYRMLSLELRPEDGRGQALARNNLASVMLAQGKFEEAEGEHRRSLALWEEALGPDHPNAASSRNNLANALFAQGKYAEAESEFRRALEIRERALGPEHPDVAGSRNNVATVLEAQGRYAEAETGYRDALSLWESALGPEHPDVAQSHNNLANVLRAQGAHSEAEVEARRALALWEKALGPEHSDVAGARNNLANILWAQGRLEDAEVEHRVALEVREKTLGAEHPAVAASLANLASVHRTMKKYDEAEIGQRRALRILEASLGSEHPHVATVCHALAELLSERGEHDEALVLAERAWSSRKGGDAPPELRGESAFLVAKILWDARTSPGERRRARGLAEEALEALGRGGEAQPEAAVGVQEWLVTHRVD